MSRGSSATDQRDSLTIARSASFLSCRLCLIGRCNACSYHLGWIEA